MPTFMEERRPEGIPTSRDIAVYAACPQYAAYCIWKYGKIPYPYPVDQKALLRFRFDVFSEAYAQVFRAIRDEGGIAHPDKIPEIVKDSYSDARRDAGRSRANLRRHYGRWEREGKRRTYKNIGSFMNKAVEYTEAALEGMERLIEQQRKWSEENFGADSPQGLIAGVDQYGKVKGHDDVVARPNIMIARSNPKRVEFIKLKGGQFTPEYEGRWLFVDQGKLAMDYCLYTEDLGTLYEAIEVFKLRKPKKMWEFAMLGIIPSEDLQIVSSAIESRIFRASDFVERLEEARSDLEEFLNIENKEVWWKYRPHYEKTCPKKHPVHDVESKEVSAVTLK